MNVLVTGAGGLIGSEAVSHYGGLGYSVIGLDNNMRREFFGPGGDVTWNIERLQAGVPGFRHLAIDIRDRAALDFGTLGATRRNGLPVIGTVDRRPVNR